MTGQTLVIVPNATVYQVERYTNAVTAIANGDFVIAYASAAENAGLEAKVGSLCWDLGRWVAALRFDDLTYAFQLPPPDGPAAAAAAAPGATNGPPMGPSRLGWCYYCLTLAADAPLELIDLLQAILASGTAYHDYQHLQQQQQQQQQQAPPPPLGARAPQEGPQQPAAGPAPGPGKADRIAVGLQRGGKLAAAGVLAMATWAGAALQRGADAAVARMQPSERQRELSPEAQAKLERAKSMAAQAAESSGRAVATALSVTSQVAAHMAQRFSESDLGRKMSSARVGNASAEDLRKVGSAGVDAFEAVYDSLADAARIVLAHTRVAATRVACHKYGPGAGQATNAGLQVAQSAVEVGLNVYKLRPTALAKGAIKGTAKNVVLGNGNQLQPQQQAQPQPQPYLPQQQQLLLPTAQLQKPMQAGPSSPAPSRSSSSTSAAPSAPPHDRTPAAGPPAAPQMPVAAVSTLAALTGPHQSGSATPSSFSAGAAGGRVAGGVGMGVGSTNVGAVVAGVPVTGPVLGQPVLVDYTPSVAAFQDATAAAAAAAGGSAGAGLPYPAVSASQYTARYYPAVPRT